MNKILSVSVIFLCTIFFTTAASATAIYDYSSKPGVGVDVGDVSDVLHRLALDRYDPLADQTGIEAWTPNGAGSNYTLAFANNFQDHAGANAVNKDTFGIYSLLDPNMRITLFEGGDPQRSTDSVTFLADRAILGSSGAEFLGFGQNFGFFFTFGPTDESVYSQSDMNDNIKGANNLVRDNQDEDFFLAYRGDGGSITLPLGVPSTFGLDDWLIVSDYYDHGTYADGTFKKDFDDLVVYVSSMQPYTPPKSVPEPGTMLLFGMGLMGLAVSRKRFLK